VSCAKTAEPIEMQFGLLTRVGVYIREPVLHRMGTFWGVRPSKNIVKDRIWQFGKRVSCAKNGCTDVNDLCVV